MRNQTLERELRARIPQWVQLVNNSFKGTVIWMPSAGFWNSSLINGCMRETGRALEAAVLRMRNPRHVIFDRGRLDSLYDAQSGQSGIHRPEFVVDLLMYHPALARH